jgi:hypothetical protein
MTIRSRVRALPYTTILAHMVRRAPAPAALALALLLGFTACTVAVDQSAPVVTNCTSGITAPVSIKRSIDVNGLKTETLIIAQVKIEGHGPYALVVDTGAAVSILDSSIVSEIGIPAAGPPEPVGGVGGQQNATPIQVNTWSLGQIRLPAARVDSLDLPDAQKTYGVRGLLGSDVLSRFGAVTVDYGSGTLIVFTQIVPTPTSTAGADLSRQAVLPHPVV